MSLFSGIGGMDLGLTNAGGTAVEMCEYWEPARRVLRTHFGSTPLSADVRDFVPRADHELLAAGFPCVDLSHAGKQAGIFGEHSGLVSEVFRIVGHSRPEWVVLENVPNLLRLGRGTGIRYVTQELERLGYGWAYRVLDSRAFGVAQRRNRVIVLASRTPGAAAAALLGDDTRSVDAFDEPLDAKAAGFYWTEGRRGVGLVRGAVPTLKGGSTLGIPSAPAVWLLDAAPGSRISVPSVEDGEALQGLERGWTACADTAEERSARWKLVGNAVTVGVAEWIGRRVQMVRYGIVTPASPLGYERDEARAWPEAAYGTAGSTPRTVVASRWPVVTPALPLDRVLDPDTLQPLSYRATRGFLSRIEESGITLDERFHDDLESHMSSMRAAVTRTESWASSEASRRRMQATRQRNTTPELRLRRALSDLGMRYRLQTRVEPPLRWRSDIVFKGARVVVDVRGCFWHACSQHRTAPKANADRWAEKLEGNRLRDDRMVAELTSRGWYVVVVWEHEDAETAARRIQVIVDERKAQTRRTSRPPAGVSVA
ncbi:DNA mismatch endonuclease Vsr [Microbacterium lacticum]